MAAPKLNARKVTEMRRQYQDGARDLDLAEWFNVSEATVRLHTKDIRRKNPRRTFDHDRAAEMFRRGATKAAIAGRFGVHRTTVGEALQRMGVAA